MSLGSIVIDLLMRTGAFETDTRRAQRRLKELEKSSREFATAFKASFAGNLLSSAVGELVSQLSRVPQALGDIVREAANFKDIEERIGAAAEEFAGFAVAAGTAGTSMQTLEDFSTKLIKNLAKVEDASKPAGAALAALGIPIAEFKRLDPVAQLERLSKALAGFRSGPEQTAVLESLARGGAQLLPFLKALEEQGGRQNILTRQQILLADEYADRQAKATAELRQFAGALAINALPALSDFQDAARDTLKAIFGLNQESNTLGRNNAVRDFADRAAIFLATLVDVARRVAQAFTYVGETVAAVAAIVEVANRGSAQGTKSAFSLDPKGFLDVVRQQTAGISEIIKAARERGEKEFAQFESFADAVRKRIDARVLQGQRLTAATDPRSTLFEGNKRRIATGGLVEGAGDKAAALAKRQLDQSLRDIESAIDRERGLLAQRQRFLDIFNAQGLVSISDYYDAQRNIIEEATQNQATLIALQIRALENAQGKLKPDERVANQTKINDLVAKGAKLEQESTQRAIELTIEQVEAERRLADQIQSINAEVLELQGNLVDAAAIRFDQRFEAISKSLRANGQTGALAQVEALKRAAVEQARFNQAQIETGRIVEGLRIEEERIQVLRQIGAASELEALARTGEARKGAIAQLESLARAQEAIARASGDADLELAAQRTRVELEKLKAVADPLGDTFRDIFTSGAAGAFEGFITGAMSAREAFDSFVASVLAGISRIVAQNLAESLFGQGSSAGGLIGTVANAIFGGSRQGGGDTLPNRSYLVGERGPERFTPRTAGTITPTEQPSGARGGQPMTVIQNFTYHGAPDRRTQAQTASDAARGLQSVSRDL